jgi:hypothetical protein
MKPASRDCMSVFREDDDPQRTETYRRGFNNGLEEAAKIVETKMWSKRRSVADLIRAQQVNT